jgi:hypothetical protein
MENGPDAKQLSQFLAVCGVMVLMFLLASWIVYFLPWMFNMMLGRD